MYKCIPSPFSNLPSKLALSDPLNTQTVSELGFLVKKEIVPVVGNPADIEKAISRYYGDSQSSVSDVLSELGKNDDIAREAAEAAPAVTPAT